MALQSLQDGLIACLYALAGAVAGGFVMYYFGRTNVQHLNELLVKIPAIRTKDIQRVQSDLNRSGVVAVLFGPLRGIAYKIYAINAHSAMSIYVFLLISIPARVIRFILTALITAFASEKFLSALSSANKVWVILICWISFYTIYFILRRQ